MVEPSSTTRQMLSDDLSEGRNVQKLVKHPVKAFNATK
jgi:hypothetical protein